MICKNHNLHDKSTFYTTIIFLILWSTFILVCVQNTFSLDHCETHNVPFVHITSTWYLNHYKKSHKFMQFTIYEAKKEIKRRLNTMHSIEMTPSWLFSHAKWKRHFFILIFCIDICSFVNNLLNNVNIFTWNPIKQQMFICQWHVDMLWIFLNDFSIFTWSLIKQHMFILCQWHDMLK
jgi:hypothetical protein